MIPSEVLEAMEQAAADQATFRNVGEYGYGGEIFDYYMVENWNEVLDAILTALATAGYTVVKTDTIGTNE